MRVDVHALSAFNGLAQRGANAASGALQSLTGEPVDVVVRGVNVAPPEAVRTQVQEGQAAVVLRLSRGIDGRAILTFSPSDVDRLRRTLPAAVEDPSAAVLEVGNILVGRLLDDIANGLGTGIHISPPTVVPAGEALAEDVRFLFECRLVAPRLDVALDLYIHLQDGAFDQLLDTEQRPRAPAVGFHELATFAERVNEGVDAAADYAAMMTGFELDAEPKGLRFVTLSEIRRIVHEDAQVGTAFSLSEPPGGFVLISFDRASAARMGTAMIPGEAPWGIGGVVTDAIVELGNIMTSGLIDGWEHLFGAGIDHSAPRLVGETGEGGILDPFVDWLDDDRRFGFLVDATVRTPAGDIGCDIYAMPDDLEFLEALDDPV